MKRIRWIPILVLLAMFAFAADALAQRRPYIGYAYPAGGQQGTTFLVKVGGQGMTDLQGATVSGDGVKVEALEYHWTLSPQYSTLMREQVKDLQALLPRTGKKAKAAPKPERRKMVELMEELMTRPQLAYNPAQGATGNYAIEKLIEKIEARNREWVNRPAVTSIAEIAYLKVTIAPGAEPGLRDLCILTTQGLSNPLTFCVGQYPETHREPMKTADFQVLGKEQLAQRKRPEEDVEMAITLPCTMNGQVASGERNDYRFSAKKGQRLVISSMARQLIPYIADAVPGWFQPVIVLHDAEGSEVAYDDDFRFKPDPVMFVDVPKDGEYVLSVYDAIYRGREDFIYRITIGEMPFITSIFPLGGRAGSVPAIEMNGWHLEGAGITPPSQNAGEGVYQIAARKGDHKTNRVPFKLDTLPEALVKEPNNDPATAQKVELPVILNGKIESRGDTDVFRFQGKAGQTIVAEVEARRLDSPVDSVLHITDESGEILFLNDDRPVMFDGGTEDRDDSLKSQGLNTHHSDSYIMCELPADGAYFLHMADTTGNGGGSFGYRLRISEPRPDFELRTVPSTIAIQARRSAFVRVLAIRKDGFDGPIRLSMRDLPEGFESSPVTLLNNRTNTSIGVTAKRKDNAGFEVFDLNIVGTAETPRGEITRVAAPAEDRMQAFLWRHLVPTEETAVKATIYDPSYKPVPRRVPELETKLDEP